MSLRENLADHIAEVVRMSTSPALLSPKVRIQGCPRGGYVLRHGDEVVAAASSVHQLVQVLAHEALAGLPAERDAFARSSGNLRSDYRPDGQPMQADGPGLLGRADVKRAQATLDKAFAEEVGRRLDRRDQVRDVNRQFAARVVRTDLIHDETVDDAKVPEPSPPAAGAWIYA